MASGESVKAIDDAFSGAQLFYGEHGIFRTGGRKIARSHILGRNAALIEEEQL